MNAEVLSIQLAAIAEEKKTGDNFTAGRVYTIASQAISLAASYEREIRRMDRERTDAPARLQRLGWTVLTIPERGEYAVASPGFPQATIMDSMDLEILCEVVEQWRDDHSADQVYDRFEAAKNKRKGVIT